MKYHYQIKHQVQSSKYKVQRPKSENQRPKKQLPAVAHYCQKCLAANSLGQEFCGRCGTRLMLVVEPLAARYDAADAGASNEEHLLERISALENRLERLSEKVDRALEPPDGPKAE